jgi:metal-dependent amidase/aminoacylase/carboxypeptidase family protein
MTRKVSGQTLSEYPLTKNDEAATRDVVSAFEQRFGIDRVQEIDPAAASEDFGIFRSARHSVCRALSGMGTDEVDLCEVPDGKADL